MNSEQLKQEVKKYWDQASCGTEFIDQEKFTLAYFEAIERHRYLVEPEIFSFAQFTRYKDKKVLEVGIGAGTDFLQWVRAGAQAYGIDLTEESLKNVTHRLQMYGLTAAEIKVADAEQLPYPDNFFELTYSWGVIHHSPNTEKCLQEIIRVTKPGGMIKVMIYNRYSLFALYRWLLTALCKGKPFRSLTHVLFHDQESPGTKAYTFKEIRNMIAGQPVYLKQLTAPATNHDLLFYKVRPFQWLAYIAACLGGWHKRGWYMMIELLKKDS